MSNFLDIFNNILMNAGAVLGVVGVVVLVAGSVLTTYLDLVGGDSELSAGMAGREGVAA